MLWYMWCGMREARAWRVGCPHLISFLHPAPCPLPLCPAHGTSALPCPLHACTCHAETKLPALMDRMARLYAGAEEVELEWNRGRPGASGDEGGGGPGGGRAASAGGGLSRRPSGSVAEGDGAVTHTTTSGRWAGLKADWRWIGNA